MAAPAQQVEMSVIFESVNPHLAQDYLWALSMAIIAAFVYRLSKTIQRRSRLIASLHGKTHRYFSIPAKWYSFAKYHLLYAPLFPSGHSSSWGLQHVSSRSQALFVTAIIVTNMILCFWHVPYGKPEVLEVVRARTGTVALQNLVPLFIMASVKNPLVSLLDISFQDFNVMHRWFGRIAVLEAALHATYHLTIVVQRNGLAAFTKSVSSSLIYTGLAGMSALIVILIQSPSIIRHAFYEAFLHLHILLAIVVLVFLRMHLDGFPQRYLLILCMVLWATYRLLRLGNLLYRSIGRRSCTATIEALPRDFSRVDIMTPRPWTYKAAQYVNITIPSSGLWTAHPFSVAWSDTPRPNRSRQSSLSSQITTNHDVEKATEPTGPQTFSFVVRPRDGFTKRLLADAIKHVPAHFSHRVPVRALIEGPYGLARSLDSYGSVLLIAGGQEDSCGRAGDPGMGREERERDRDCVEKWVNDILQMDGRKEVFRLEIWVTQGTVFESRSPSSSVIVRRGRPDLSHIVSREAQRRLGCMGVSVCGPGGLQGDARKAVRQSIKDGRNVEFAAEAFGW